VRWRDDGSVELAGPQYGCDLVRGTDGQALAGTALGGATCP
jgi:hypothetical protein